MLVLVDADVILDFLLEREPFFDTASELLELNAKDLFEAYISPITPVNVFYSGRKVVGAAKIKQGIADLMKLVQVCSIGHACLSEALASPFTDLEGAVQHACASANTLDVIVTRNLDDYKNASLPAYAPTEFLNTLKPEQK